VKKYYLQMYCHEGILWDQESRVLMDDLPFQPLLLERMEAIGIIEPKDRMLTLEEVEKVGKILRLRNSLGVNLSGSAIIIELLDRLEAMEAAMKRHHI